MSVSVSIVRAMIDEIERRGLDARGLLETAAIDAALLDDPRARVDDRALDAMTHAAIALTGDTSFGLAMGEHASLASFGLVGHMAVHCRTVQESFTTVMGYARIVADVTMPRIVETGGRVHLVCDPFTTNDAVCNRMRAEFLMVRLLDLSRRFTGSEDPDIEYWFPYPRPENAEAYTRLFEGRERFDKPMFALVFAPALLEASQRHHDVELLSLLRAQGDRWLKALDDDRGIVARVRELLLERGAPIDVEMQEVARKLGMSERSLRRRLAAAGASFHDVLHEAKATVAKGLLSRADATLEGVAKALGFEHVHAFQRAFKRWSGERARDVLARRDAAH